MLTNSNFYIGDSSVSRLYQGDNLIWDASHPDICLEYIANGADETVATPTVYFDTGFVADGSTKIELKCASKDITHQQWYLGALNASYYGIEIGINQNTTAPYTRIGTYLDDGSSFSSIQSNVPYINTLYADASSQVTIFDGSISTITSGNVNPSSFPSCSITLFARNLNGTPNVGNSNYGSGKKIYYCKVWDDNNLIRFYIPVLHYTNGQYVPCLYDKVNDTYFYNLGTDTPTYKIQGDYLLDYLGTEPETEIPTTGGYTGMQYDTGVVASTSLSVDIKGRIVWGSERNLFASATDNVTTPTWKTYGFTTSGGSTDAEKCRLVFQWGANDGGTVRTFISMDSSSLVVPHRISMYHDNNNIAHGYLDDTFYTASNVSFNFSPNSLYLLNRHNNSVTTQAGPGTRVYYANFTTSNIPTKTYVPVFHNNQAAFLDLNSGTYIYNMGTQTPYYILKS